ncbi:hypothetical protein ABEB36_013456 [Hypothenemus hampei]|uniref:Uncharacterized protein n=1 Tax=Hypothenemus hampei TaxID=57062 RepID=A0ABD1E8A1_HYPHA
MWKLILFLPIFFCVAIAIENSKVSLRDSYLDAYQELKNKAQKKSDQVYPAYSGNQYGPIQSPTYQYGPPVRPLGQEYGPPPPSQYQPSPNGLYGEAQYGPVYGQPAAQNLQVFYGVPHAMINVWDRFLNTIKWKLDVFTIGKIILKLVIFKKIVSFIAIICLLLFIPSLKHKKVSNDVQDEINKRNLLLPKANDKSLEEIGLSLRTALQTHLLNHPNMNRKTA